MRLLDGLPGRRRQRLEALGEELGRADRWDELVMELERIDGSRLTGADAEIWFQLRGIADERLGHPDARRWFEEGLARCPASALLAFSLGQALQRVGRWTEAERLFAGVRLGRSPEQARQKLDAVPSQMVMAIVRYCYLWGSFDEGQRHLQQLLDVYGELVIADDTFVFIRGLPFVSEVLSTKAAVALLAGQEAAARKTLQWAETRLADIDLESDRLLLEAWMGADWRPLLESLRRTLEAGHASGGYVRMMVAAIESRDSQSINEGQASLDAVQLGHDDRGWLDDIRTLAKYGLSVRFGDSVLRDAASAELFEKQPLLFEPHHAYAFGLLDVQEPLRLEYQQRCRADFSR